MLTCTSQIKKKKKKSSGIPEIPNFLQLNWNLFLLSLLSQVCPWTYHSGPLDLLLTQNSCQSWTQQHETTLLLYGLLSLRNSVVFICILAIYGHQTFILLWQDCAPNSELRHERKRKWCINETEKAGKKLHEARERFYPYKFGLGEYWSENTFQGQYKNLRWQHSYTAKTKDEDQVVVKCVTFCDAVAAANSL